MADLRGFVEIRRVNLLVSVLSVELRYQMENMIIFISLNKWVIWPKV